MAHLDHCFQVELVLGILVYVEGGKPEDPEKNPQNKDENNQTQPTCDIRSGSRTQATAVGEDTFLDVPCSKCLGSSCNMCHGREDTV